MKRFELIEHTADVGLIAYGETLAEAFANAAYGMFSIIAELDAVQEVESHPVEISGDDIESLLFEWLNRLLYFFDVDDIEQHGDFFIKTRNGWTFHDFEKDFDLYYEWYKRFFKQAKPSQCIGEDTTTYLASKQAAKRIERLLPDVKLLVMLRDPVARAYSHYWHNMAAGRTVTSFDNAIRLHKSSLISRGFYAEQLRRYTRFIEAGRLKVVLFEDLVQDTQGTVDDICQYLELEGSIDVSSINTHQNSATVPLEIPLRILANRLYLTFAANRSRRNIPNMPAYREPSEQEASAKSPILSRIWKLYRNRLPSRNYPPMADDTRSFLEKLYRRSNAGLSELIDDDVSRQWPCMRE